MPFDERTTAAFAALADARVAHLSALATTVDEVRTFLESRRAERDGPADRLSAEFGALAGAHIDTERLAALVADAPAVDARTAATVGRALETLTELADASDERFMASVPSGASLYRVVGDALAEAGRAFGATRVVELARARRYRASDHSRYLKELPFAEWTVSERRVAPPLVVEVDGADLQVSGLAEFLDGNQKLILVVRGEAPPAPLVRLITPGVFIAQCTGDTHLGRLATWGGSGLIALVPRTAAQFVHDPAAGDALADRLTVSDLPEERPTSRVGGLTSAQQTGELEQLLVLTRTGSAPETVAGDAPASADPADKLAAWLLSQANIPGSG